MRFNGYFLEWKRVQFYTNSSGRTSDNNVIVLISSFYKNRCIKKFNYY